MNQLSAAFNQRKAGTLLRDTVQNPRKDGSCVEITTRCGKVLANLSVGKPVVDIMAENIDKVDIDHLVESEKPDKIIQDAAYNSQQADELKREEDKEKKVVVNTLPETPHLFP